MRFYISFQPQCTILQEVLVVDTLDLYVISSDDKILIYKMNYIFCTVRSYLGDVNELIGKHHHNLLTLFIAQC